MREPPCIGSYAPPQYVEVAIAADSYLCPKYASLADMETAIRDIVDVAESYYRVKMCIRFTITHMDFHCDASTDPYRNIPQDGNPMEPFRNIRMNGPNANARRHIAILLTGINYAKNVAGQVKAIGVTCIPDLSFAWMDVIISVVFAHELGHNLNARHVSSGIMFANVTRGNLFFSDESVDQIVRFVDAESVASSCIRRDNPSEQPPSPSASPSSSPTKEQTCKALLKEKESFLCSRVRTNAFDLEAIVEGIRLSVPLQVSVQERYGILLTITASQ